MGASVLLAVPLLVALLWPRTPAVPLDAGDLSLAASAAAAQEERGPRIQATADTTAGAPPVTTGVAAPPVSAPPADPPANVPAPDSPAAAAGVREPALPPSTRPLATEGRLTIVSQPPGANVTVNGIGHGATPATIRFLRLGEQRIRLTMDGYRSEERVVRLAGTQPAATVRITLRRLE